MHQIHAIGDVLRELLSNYEARGLLGPGTDGIHSPEQRATRTPNNGLPLMRQETVEMPVFSTI